MVWQSGCVVLLALCLVGAEAPDRMESGCAKMAAKQYAEAIGDLEAVAGREDAPTGFRSLAKLRVIQCQLRLNQFDLAKNACEELRGMTNVPPHHVWEAEEILKRAERMRAGLPARDPMESRVKVAEVPEPGVTLYVAPNGDDGGDGTVEAPFKTLQRALEAGSGVPAGGVKICLREGVYPLSEGVKIVAGMSGGEDGPLVICSYPGERARLSGGKAVTGFRPAEDASILARLPEEARGKVLVADLKSQGITEYGTPQFRGFGCGSKSSVELFVDGKPMQPARWPNEGFVKTGKVLDPGALRENRGGVFEYEGDRPARWTQARDIWLYGYWYYDWADNAIGVASVDPASHQIRTTQTCTYGIKEGQSYYAFNLLEEIDVPGEWYLDREAGLLYLCPPSDLSKAEVELSILKEPLIQMDGVSHVRLERLTFELGAGDGIVINDGEDCLVAGCELRRLGASGVTISGGHGCGVLGCDMHTLGRGGVVMIGGERKTLTPGNHFVENCHIYDFSRIDRTYTPAVQIEGVGNRIAHNRFHDTPCHAMRLEGNDHVVELNEVHDVVRESDDQGGIDLFLNPSYRGNVIRYNYWHDIGNGKACGQAGIRLDDAISGTVIYGNVFMKCSEANFGGVQIHGGKDNWVDNNVFIDCKHGISFSAWGADRWKKFLSSDSVVALLTKDVDVKNPPYSTRYPDLARLEEGNDVNNIWRNVVYRCGDFLTRDQGIQNEISNSEGTEDPGFVDAEKGNWALKEDSAVFDGVGFCGIPFGEIGLYGDGYRD